MGRSRIKWQMGGLLPTNGLPIQPLSVPASVELDAGWITWRDGEPWHEVNPPEDLLFRFADLATAKPSEIVKFARRWGVLGTCSHGLPHVHVGPPALALRQDDGFCGLLPNWSKLEGKGAWWPPKWLGEPVEAWRFFAGHSARALSLLVELRAGSLGAHADWRSRPSTTAQARPSA